MIYYYLNLTMSEENKHNNITFVSSFLNIYDTPFLHRNTTWFFERFEEIASTHIHICLYISACYQPLIEPLLEKYPTIKIMQYLDFQETSMSSLYSSKEYSLPTYRNHHKDTKEYMLLMNAKIDFICDTIQSNPWNSTHFAWIDFGITHIFNHKEESLYYLQQLHTLNIYQQDSFLFIPGCWEKIIDMSSLCHHVNWRFCGGFFLGDKQSLLDFHALYISLFPLFLEQTKYVVWEVNFWAWLECYHSWKPNWYLADHNDSILKIPLHHTYTRLCSYAIDMIQYDYPEILSYQPNSASYLYYQGQHLLNTRYVNYSIQPNGSYAYKTSDSSMIQNINLFSLLDNALIPQSFQSMNEESIDLISCTSCYSIGLEDIRLFEYQNAVHFIATNVNYSSTGNNQMIVGQYHIDTCSYSHCHILQSPSGAYCEKNWIPIVSNNTLFFIYKWYPYELGIINDTYTSINIVQSIPIQNPLFQHIRGSTTFVPYGHENGHLLGLVHFSNDTKPRQYFNIMVLLDKDTLHPLKYSNIFYFENIGIEFCLGFTIVEDHFKFWISRLDRNPLFLSCPISQIQLCHCF